MTQPPQKTVVNQTLLIWCAIVIVELFVIAKLMDSAIIVFLAFILYWPISTALKWPIASSDSDSKLNLKTR